MQESGFYISARQGHFVIRGGKLWQAPKLEEAWGAQLQDKKLIISFRPGDTLEEVFTSLRKQIRQISWRLSLRLFASALLTPLVLVLPAIILIVFIGTVGAYGNLINELISAEGGGNAMTHLGITKYKLFFIQTTIYIVGAYAFPLFFQGDYDDTISRFKKLTDNQQIMKARLQKALSLLQKRGYIDRIVLWNPNLVSPENQWIGDTLLPAIVTATVPLSLMVKVEEQFLSRSLLEKLSGKALEWKESKEKEDTEAATPIPYSYLEGWEKEMWQIFSAASTLNLPAHWQAEGENPPEGSLPGVVSLSLARQIVGHFRNRLFSAALDEYEASVSLFASRCINDYGLLRPLRTQNLNQYQGDPKLLREELTKLREERSYVFPYLQRQAGELLPAINDIAGLIILAGTQASEGVYKENKRQCIQAFVERAARQEQLRVLRYFWDKLIVSQGQLPREAENELFRLIETPTLQDLVLAFRRAGMYEKTHACYHFLRAIYPIQSSIGEAVVLSEQGKYEESIEKFLETEATWMGDLYPEKDAPGSADVYSRLSLNLFMCVVIVMNRVDKYRELAERSLDLVGRLLLQMNDGERDNQQLTRYYNVLASYHEWMGDYARAIETYEKGLSIPGVGRSLISSLMVNKGIAYRMLAKETEESPQCISLLKDGVRYNLEGVNAKAAIGNADQLPIALHNLAETYLELAHHLEDLTAKQVAFEAAQRHSREGLSINHRINSSKKRGQLLAERFLASQGLTSLQEDQDLDPGEIRELSEWLTENESSAGYDIEVVKDLLHRLGQGPSTQQNEIINWLDRLGTSSKVEP